MAIARFEIEAKAAGKLSNELGVQGLDYGVDIVIAYIAMEFLEREFREGRINREGGLYPMSGHDSRPGLHQPSHYFASPAVCQT